MARAAVKAKQAQAAQAQVAAKPSRNQRKHASGGNPTQDLFFSRLRRKQKWVFVVLALAFALSFVLLGVGSGNGNNLEQTVSGWISSLFGGNSDAISKAQAEIKKGDPKGYLALADAYTAQGNPTLAISSMETYLRLKKKDGAAWSKLAYLKQTQAGHYYSEYQQIQLANALEAPSAGLQPTGILKGQLGTIPIDDYYSKQNDALLTPLYRNVTTGYSDSLAAFKQAAKFAKTHDDLVNAIQNVATAAQYAGQPTEELAAWQRYVNLVPNAPNLTQIEAVCKTLKDANGKPGSCVPKKTTK
jgi:tetratricopeptide (TPR) repeat protein